LAPSLDDRKSSDDDFPVSLMSRDKGLARRLGAELPFVSDLLAPELSCGRLAASAFKAIMVAVARGEAARLECCACEWASNRAP
jgi:hypothetical protein